MVMFGGANGGADGGANGGANGGADGGANGQSGEVFLRQHADGTRSPLLSNALIAAHDALASQWTGGADMAPKTFPTDNQYLEHLRTPSQELLLDCQLSSALDVKGSDGSATLQVRGAPITKIDRPSDAGYFETQLNWLRAYADLRSDRMPEIYEQVRDPMAFFGALTFLDTGRRKYTLMMLSAVRTLAIKVETPVKFFCRQKRPIDYSTSVHPMIQTPDHSSFPSGHATEAFAMATVLYRLSATSDPGATTGDPQEGIDRQSMPFLAAHRIATNRTVAGVHFPADSHAGALLGCQVGELFYHLAVGGTVEERNWTKLGASEDFLLSSFQLGGTGTTINVQPDAVVRSLYQRAQSEWS